MARRPNKSTGTSTDSGIYSQDGGRKCDTIADIRDAKMTNFTFEFSDSFHPGGGMTGSFVIRYVIQGTVLFSCEKLSCASNCVTDAPGEGVPFWVTGEIRSDDIDIDIVNSILLARKRYTEKLISGPGRGVGGESFADKQERYEERGREYAEKTGETFTSTWWRSRAIGLTAGGAADRGWISDPRNLPNWDGDWSGSMGATSWEMEMFKSKFPQSMNDTLKDMKGQGIEDYGALEWLYDLGITYPNPNWLCYCERVFEVFDRVVVRSSLDSLLPRD